MASDNKGIWIALYVFGGLKGAAGLVLMIVGIILMAHSPRECGEIDACYKEKGIPPCTIRRLTKANYTQSWDLDSEDPQSFLPRVKQFTADVLGLNHKALQVTPAKAMAGQLHDIMGSARQLKISCYETYPECDEDMEKMSTEAGNWGTSLLVIGLICGFSGILSFLSGKKKTKVWLGITMAIDIIMMITCIAMWFLCGIIAAIMKTICDHIQEKAGQSEKECWEDFIGDVCSWADLFGTANLMFLLMFAVMLGTSITDCGACCCCTPTDAAWHVQAQQAQAGGGMVVGKPVEADLNAKP